MHRRIGAGLAFVCVFSALVGCGGASGGDRAAILAFDGSNGRVLWQVEVPEVSIFVSRSVSVSRQEVAAFAPMITADTVSFHAVARLSQCSGEEIDITVDRASGAILDRKKTSLARGGSFEPAATAEAESGSLRVVADLSAEPPFVRGRNISTLAQWETPIPPPLARALSKSRHQWPVLATDGTTVYLAIATVNTTCRNE